MWLADGMAVAPKPQKPITSAPTSSLSTPTRHPVRHGYSRSPLQGHRNEKDAPAVTRKPRPTALSTSSANAFEYRLATQYRPTTRHSAHPHPKPRSKPTPPPLGSANAFEYRLAMQYHPTAHRSTHPKPKQSSKPTPAPGTAGDLAAATQNYRTATRGLTAARNLPPSLNRGHVKEMAIRDAQESLSSARARVRSAQAAKRVETAHNLPPSLNRGHVKEMEIRDAQHSYSLARTNYFASRGLDSSGRPIKIEPPKPPAPAKPKPKESHGFFSWAGDKISSGVKYAWEHKSEIGHTALDVVGTVDPTGLADGANAVWYLAEGDKTNAAISAAGMIPYVGDAAKVGKYGAKAYKATKVVKETMVVASEAKLQRTYITYTIKDSTGNVRYVGRASGYGSPGRVLENRAQGHHILRTNPDLQKPQLEAIQGNWRANRGAEDVLYSRHQTIARGDRNGARTVQVIQRNGRKVTINNGANFGGSRLLNGVSPIGNSNTEGRRYIAAYAKDLRTPF